MAFSDSSPVKIPLSDPMVRYGKTFRISNIYLSSSSEPRTAYNLPSSSSALAVYQQDFQSQYLSIGWNIIDPANDYINTTSNEIISNPYVSGFNVAIYQNSGDLTGINALAGRTKVFEEKGILGKGFNYEITGDRNKRNYSAEVTFVDFTGNKSSALLTSLNPEPEFNITGSGLNNGVFSVSYSGKTDSNNKNISNGLESVDLYLFSGLDSGEFSQEASFVKQARRIVSGLEFNGEISIELEPGLNNYVMAVGRDQYNTGRMVGLFQNPTYVETSGFSGLVGGGAPELIPYPIRINPTTGERIQGGDGIYYSFDPTYSTGSLLIKTSYGIRATGETTGAVSGFSGEIYFDSGQAYDTDYNAWNTGSQVVYDNTLYLQSGLNTGVSITQVESTGEGYTGHHRISSGAGFLWAQGAPKYSSSGSGIYEYGYYDGSLNVFNCASEKEFKDGYIDVPGIYSMPGGNPNSYDIKFRDGVNFSKGYEQAASYLNAIGEMPAVILNNSQLNKIKSLGGKNGWVGLRRKKVALLSGIFSEDYLNQTFFRNTDFVEATESGISVINTTGAVEENKLYVNDLGDEWGWVNERGTAIFKYAGSGYNKIREAELSVDVERTMDATGYYLTAQQVNGNAYLLTQQGGLIQLENNQNVGIQNEGFYYPVYINSDDAGFPCNIYIINDQKFYTPRNQPLTRSLSLPSPNIYKEYLDPFITGVKISGYIDKPQIKTYSIETGNTDFAFNLNFEKQYYNELIADPADPNYNNINLNKINLHTGEASGIVPGTGNLYSEVTGTSVQQSQSVQVSFQGSLSGTNPEFFRFVPYDQVSSGVNTEISGRLDPKLDSQSITQSLDALVAPPVNAIDITFPYPHSSPPTVSYTLGYTGVGGSIGYMGAMIVGEPTEVGVTFALTAAPSALGYVLYVETVV